MYHSQREFAFLSGCYVAYVLCTLKQGARRKMLIISVL